MFFNFDKEDTKIAVCFLGSLITVSAIIGFIVGWLVFAYPKKDIKQEAIDRGFASYKVDNKGVVTFEWNK